MDEIIKFPKHKEEKPKLFEKNINIKIATLFKVIFILLLAVGFFCLGRYLFPASDSLLAAKEGFTNSTDQSFAEEDSADQENAASDDTITVSNVQASTLEEPDQTSNETAVSTEQPEKFITKNYQHVELTIKEIDFEWRDTWGKISRIYYTINNQEDGTIQPKYFEFSMEGYVYPKIFDVPLLDQKVPKNTSLNGAVDFAFTYNEDQVDPTAVPITLKVFDESNTTITYLQKTFNLKE